MTINLSDVNLSATQLSVLDRGLTFIPTYRYLPLDEIYSVQDRLIRNIKLRDYFKDRADDTYDYHQKTFTNPSTWIPPDHKISQSTLDMVQTIANSTESLIRRHPIVRGRFLSLNSYHDNLTTDERIAIQELRSNPDIVIKPARRVLEPSS